jgi:hypothetical protein
MSEMPLPISIVGRGLQTAAVHDLRQSTSATRQCIDSAPFLMNFLWQFRLLGCSLNLALTLKTGRWYT